MALSHAFSCTVADGTVTAVARPSDWNAAHTIGAGTAAYGLIPVGGVVNWAGLIANVPAGYLVCDGTSLLRAGTYADLFAAIGTIFGFADASHFNLPDLRDKFVVGAKEDDTVPKTNIRGSLEQSITVTGVTLTHDGAVADHTSLTHAGAAVAAHPDLTHAAIAIGAHPSTQFTGTVGPHAVHTSVATSSAANTTGLTVSAHAVTWPGIAAITHDVSVQAGTHVGTSVLTHNVSAQAGAHGAAGTVSHSFTPPAQHVASIVPAFLAMAFIVRYA